ncbi:nucleoside hydrolase [Aureobasidium pullulans]|uniref:Nucleoside hydrolase n=1 Tax=Aureobasidium pullulans TaxID=5580 RepID=A0A4S9K0A2_AURPU|nr:nucleoside hydrolase [Aureobasidium pullulans]THY08612.1 nucleoside hydrolase [Aureobasidium pullulans]THY58957.1 nucleoside hydrolase [Aureobasidium pullulans]
MAPKQKIIIDTDPGVDDILAMLLAFSVTPEEIEVLLISLTFGNIDVQNCLRNAVSLFHHMEQEIAWRQKNGKDLGFETLRASKPLVAVGAEEPLAEQLMMADFFHGIDGLGGIHSSHPHLTPQETWKTLFDASQEVRESSMFRPSQRRSHEEILRLLKENEPDTITIVAIGPLTNLAIAAAQDPETFLRVKEVVVMGNTINEPGNVRQPPPPIYPSVSIPEPPFRLIKAPQTLLRTDLNIRNQVTPVAEFNTYADSIATARVYALTSPTPNSTIPPALPGSESLPHLAPYPAKLSRQLKLTVFPLDITTPHKIIRGQVKQTIQPLIEAGSPLAEWTAAFLNSTFAKVESLMEGVSGDSVGLELHDPLCIWYAITHDDAGWKIKKDEDIRIETTGQWTRGMTVVDTRGRKKRAPDDGEGEIPGDAGNWLSPNAGNRVGRCVQSPGVDLFAPYLLRRVFGA